MSENTNTLLDLGAMLEENLDAIPEAAEYATPPAGEYRLQVTECKIDKYQGKEKDANGKETGNKIPMQRLKMVYTIQETKSVAGDEQPVPNGTLFSENFMGTEQGLGYFKTRIKNILNVESTAGSNLAQLMEAAKGSEFDCRISIKKSPNPKGGEYENVQLRVIPPAVSD